MIVFLILFSTLGIKHPPIEDEMIKDFTVNELVDETTADCSENPSSGGTMDQSLKIEFVEPLMPENTCIIPNSNTVSTLPEKLSHVTPTTVPVRPKPDPDPHPKPIDAITPEPPAIFIVVIAVFLGLIIMRHHLSFRRPPRRCREAAGMKRPSVSTTTRTSR